MTLVAAFAVVGLIASLTLLVTTLATRTVATALLTIALRTLTVWSCAHTLGTIATFVALIAAFAVVGTCWFVAGRVLYAWTLSATFVPCFAMKTLALRPSDYSIVTITL